MTKILSTPCTAFSGNQRIATGALIDVALAVKAAEAERPGPFLTFDDETGKVIDLDLRGTTAEIVARLTERDQAETAPPGALAPPPNAPTRRRGRPRLGVVAREVTLLPQHWEWLSRQPKGASQALRRLVTEARRKEREESDRTLSDQRTYRFLSALAGDLPGYEEVIRALFAGQSDIFAERMAGWPEDVRNHALALARPSPKEDQA